jgi:pheromone shutdown protein TraB
MYKITLIGSAHKESGECTVSSLYNIIEDINPDIIFEEINSQSYVAEYIYNGDSELLEQNAIKKYKENYVVKNIPIDTYLEPENFVKIKEKIIDLDNELNNRNENTKEYYDLTTLVSECIENGFENINTEYFEELIIKQYQLKENYIKKNRIEFIDDYYKFFDFIFEKRENRMVVCINKYIELNELDSINAIILIGAAHRTSIMKKLKRLKYIEYDFYYKSKSNGT